MQTIADHAIASARALVDGWTSTADMMEAVRTAAAYDDLGFVVLALDTVVRAALQDVAGCPYDVADMRRVLAAVRARYECAPAPIAALSKMSCDPIEWMLRVLHMVKTLAEQRYLDDEGATTLCALRGCTDPVLIAAFCAWNTSYVAWESAAPRTEAERDEKMLADGASDSVVRQALVAVWGVNAERFDAYTQRMHDAALQDDS